MLKFRFVTTNVTTLLLLNFLLVFFDIIFDVLLRIWTSFLVSAGAYRQEAFLKMIRQRHI